MLSDSVRACPLMFCHLFYGVVPLAGSRDGLPAEFLALTSSCKVIRVLRTVLLRFMPYALVFLHRLDGFMCSHIWCGCRGI